MAGTAPGELPVVRELVEAIGGEVEREIDCSRVPGAVAAIVTERLELLAAGLPDATGVGRGELRRWLLHSATDGAFSVVMIGWGPDSQTAIHDHLAWCVVGVLDGEATETRFRLEARDGRMALKPTGVQLNPAGAIEAIMPPGDIHHVSNRSEEIARSLHVYGVDLSVTQTSCRRLYDALPMIDA